MTPTTTPAAREILGFLPKYLDVEATLRGGDYLVGGESFRRVSTCTGVINKPMLIPWAKRTTLEKVEEILRNPETRDGLMDLVWEEAEGGRAKDDATWHEDYGGWVQRLLDTAGKAADEKRDAAADKGTSIHEVIAAVLDDPINNPPSKEARHALQFIADHGVTVDATEIILWDDTLKVAGTCDAVGRDREGQRIIWDWKTGSGPWPEMAFQLGAYAGMLTGLTREGVHAAYIVKIKSDGYELHEIRDLDGAELAFYYAATLHDAMKPPKGESGGKASWWVEL